jgi:hypothetical protein
MISTRGTGIIPNQLAGASSEVKLVIHHQLSDIGLVSPVYAGDGITCYLAPDQCVDAGSTTQASFNIDSDKKWSIGALIYNLQRKNIDQSSKEAISNEEETIYIELVVIWKVYRSAKFYVYSFLMEHEKGHAWDRDKLLQLAKHYKLNNMQRAPIEETWLMRDHTVIMTRMNITREACCKLEMTISRTSIKDDTQRPRYIDVDR